MLESFTNLGKFEPPHLAAVADSERVVRAGKTVDASVDAQTLWTSGGAAAQPAAAQPAAAQPAVTQPAAVQPAVQPPAVQPAVAAAEAPAAVAPPVAPAAVAPAKPAAAAAGLQPETSASKPTPAAAKAPPASAKPAASMPVAPAVANSGENFPAASTISFAHSLYGVRGGSGQSSGFAFATGLRKSQTHSLAGAVGVEPPPLSDSVTWAHSLTRHYTAQV